MGDNYYVLTPHIIFLKIIHETTLCIKFQVLTKKYQ